MTKCWLGAAVVAAALWPGDGRADWRSDVPVFRIGILGGALEASQLDAHACLERMVEDELNVAVDLRPSSDYAGVLDGLLAGQLEAATLGSGGYASVHLQNPDAVEPLAVPVQIDGSVGYHSVLVVRADSDFETVDDLGGSRLAFTDRNSTSGFLVPWFELSQQGFSPNRYFGQMTFTGGHPQAVDGVVRGLYDAAFTWTSAIGDPGRGYSRGNLRRMVERGTLDMDDVRIVWKSALIAEGPHVVSKSLPSEAKDLYRQVLFDLADRDRGCFEGIVGGQAIDFGPIDQDYYRNIVEIRRAQDAALE